MKRKLVSILLIVLLSVALVVPALAEDAPAVTRAGWISQLVQTFGLTVEDDNYPDNYYSDLTSDRSDYHDILTAVEFGLVDLDLGEAFRPDEAATREFAAQTLNYCLGYQLDADTEYTFTEAADLLNCPDDLQVAVNRGWFQLVDGEALPDQPLTADEQTAMLADAKAALQGEVIDPEHENSYTFTADVVEIPDGTTVTVSDGEIRVLNSPVEVAQGNIIAVYQNGIPTAYTVNTVSKELTTLVLGVTQLENTEDIYTGIDAQGTVEASLEDVVPLDPDAELSYYLPATGVEYATYEEALDAAAQIGSPNASAKPDIELVFKNTISLENGVSLSLDAKLKNAVVDYKISVAKMQAYVKLSFDAEISYKVKFDTEKEVQADDINLLFWGIPGVGGVTIGLETELDATVSGIQKWHATCGVEVSKADGVRVPNQFDTKAFAVSVEGSAKLGLKAKFGVTELPAVKAYIYGSLGATGKLKSTTYDDAAEPARCTHFAAYLYAKCGVTGSVKLLSYKKTVSLDYSFYNEKNSPLRIVHHYEDGKLVEACTRDGAGVPTDSIGSGNGYTTPSTSPYAGSGWGSGTAQTSNYTYSLDEAGNATITRYSGTDKVLIIPDTLDGHPVTAIGELAFSYKRGLQSVLIPDSVTAIGYRSFSNCSSLSTISLPNGLTSIGTHCFMGCTSLSYILIPKTLTTVTTGGGYSAGNVFSGCTALSTIEIERGMTRIPDALFSGTSIETITIPDTVTEIGNGAFQYSSLKSIVIPDSVTSIGNNCFSGCTNLSSVKLSSNLTNLDYYAFSYCSSLSYILIPKTLTTTASSLGVFGGCSSLTTIEIEDGMTSVPDHLFAYCSAIETITIPDSVTKLEGFCFYGCTNLKEIIFSRNLTTIGMGAFMYCSSLERVELPDSLETIDQHAFEDCTSLSSVTLPEKLDLLHYQCFKNCASLRYIKIPANVRTWATSNTGVFEGCTNLTTIELEDGMKTIPGSLLSFCTSIETIALPSTIEKIGNGAFRGCTGLKEIAIPSSVTEIGFSAFEGCTGLTEMVIPSSVTEIGSSAFKGCTGFTEMVIPDSVIEIDNSAFADCINLSAITLSKKVEYLGTNCFKNCTSLRYILLPASICAVSTSEGGLFSGCTNLTSIELEDGLTWIPHYYFMDCSAITSFTMPNSVKHISIGAFWNCTNLAEIHIPDSVVYIDADAFSYPNQHTIYGVAGSYAETFANENSIPFIAEDSTSETLPGDLNGDGSLTSADLVLLSKALTGSITLTDAQKTAADLNGDGNITSADAVLLAKKLIAQ